MNFETTYELGEVYRALSWRGGANSLALAKSAIEWYDRGIKLDPYDGYNWLRKGMCLDWMGSDTGAPAEDSSACFQRAEELDPNGYYTAANIGWHYAESGDYAAARSWYQRSLRLEWVDNDIAADSLALAERRLKEAAEAASDKPPIFHVNSGRKHPKIVKIFELTVRSCLGIAFNPSSISSYNLRTQHQL